MALMRGDFSSDTISADNDARVEWSAATAIEDPPAPSCAGGTGVLPYLHTVFLLVCHGRYMTCPMRRGKSAVMFW